MNKLENKLDDNLDSNCLFCRIIKGEIPSDKVYEDDDILVFKDIEPKAPIHYLGVPKVHYQNIAEFSDDNPLDTGIFIQKLTKLGNEVSNGQFQTIFNTGKKAGQSVFHVHGHILA